MPAGESEPGRGEPAAVFVEEIELWNFRNYRAASVALAPGIFIVKGRNGAGKTNLVEAVYVLGNGRSWRPGGPGSLVAKDAEEAVVAASAVSKPGASAEGTRSRLAARIGQRTELYVDGARTTVARAGRGFPVVVFSPDDLDVVKGPSEKRREYLDRLGGRAVAGYDSARKAYERAHRQRSVLIKEAHARGHRGVSETIEEWNSEFAMHSAMLLTKRLEVYSRVRDHFEEALGRLDVGGRVCLHYTAVLDQPTTADSWEAALAGDIESVAREYYLAITRRLEEEIRRGHVLVGPQRDDMEIRVGGLSSREGVSQGQQRLIAVALRLAEAEVLKEDVGRRPVLVMDDVFSELDGARRERVWEFIRPEQGFITSASDEIPGVPRRDLPVYTLTVDGGTISGPKESPALGVTRRGRPQ